MLIDKTSFVKGWPKYVYLKYYFKGDDQQILFNVEQYFQKMFQTIWKNERLLVICCQNGQK